MPMMLLMLLFKPCRFARRARAQRYAAITETIDDDESRRRRAQCVSADVVHDDHDKSGEVRAKTNRAAMRCHDTRMRDGRCRKPRRYIAGYALTQTFF